MRVLIIEDEERLAGTLKDLLESNGYSADTVGDGESGFDEAASGAYDAVLLDVMLPKLSGYLVVKRLREAGVSTPVLMLTARSDVSDKVMGLDCGADYYLTKPFDSEELLACVRSLLRRQGGTLSDTLTFGDLTLNLSTCRLSCGESELRLSSKELDILRLLFKNGERIVPKETMIVKVWGYDSEVEDNNVEVYISFLRKKFAQLKSNTAIVTVRRVGYHLEVSPDA